MSECGNEWNDTVSHRDWYASQIPGTDNIPFGFDLQEVASIQAGGFLYSGRKTRVRCVPIGRSGECMELFVFTSDRMMSD